MALNVKMFIRCKVNILTAGMLVIVAALLTTEVSSQTPRATEGVLDLRSWDWEGDQDIALRGEWEFYWEKFVPAGMDGELITSGKDYITLPSVWNGHLANGNRIGPYGFATYRLKILLSDTVSSLAIRTRVISTSYDLYVNGEKILFAGKPGKTKASDIPEYHPNVASFASAGELEIVLHVSNFDHRVGGARDTIILGKDKPMFKARGLELITYFFLAGCFFIMGLYHVVLYIIKRDMSPLFFSLFCIVLMIRLLVTGEIPINSFFIPDWHVLIRVEYLSFYIGFTMFFGFFSSLFKEHFTRRILLAVFLLLGALSLLVLVTPPNVFTRVLIPTQIVILILAVYTFYVLYVAYRRGNKEAVIFLIGYILLTVFIVNDVLYADEIIETGHFFSVGLFLFLVFQSVLLSRRYSLTFKRNESLIAQLDIANQDLEKKVEERTHRLVEQKEDLKQKHIQIKKQNAELRKINSELDRFVYSVSHDLKAPLSSMLGLINLSNSENDPETLKSFFGMMERSIRKQNEFISEILDYSRNTRLEISLDQINFKELMDSVFEQYQFIEQWKSIKKEIIIDHEEIFVTDRQRLNIILNNIVSNALKYSTVGNKNPEVRAYVKVNGDYADIEIIDNGSGIKPDRIEKVFDMFYRADDKRSGSGSGLGLYIVKETIDKLDGKINIESEVGKFTKVSVIIPNLSNKDISG